MRHLRRSTLLAITAAALFLAACGGADDATSDVAADAGSTTEPMASMTDDAHAGDDGDAHMGDETMGEDGHDGMAVDGDYPFGEPAEAAAADRVIEIQATDQLAFDPDELDVAPGETVTLRIVNTGSVDHELVLGDEQVQADMEQAMQEGTMHHGSPNVVTVPAGETVQMTWTFNEQADGLIYGCHVAGHYDAGMRGTIRVSG